MAIKLPQGFDIQSRQAIDNRLVLSKADMLAVVDRFMPSKYIAVCLDDGKFYLYDKDTTSISEETGKFKLIDEQVLNNIRFTALESTVGDENSGLVKDVKAAKSSITELQSKLEDLNLANIPGIIDCGEVL